MLLGSADTRQQQYPHEELLISHLISECRYAEAYLLLQREQSDLPATQFNLALCYYYAGNYQQSLIHLDKAKAVLLPVRINTNLRDDQFYKAIRQQQNQLNDHLQAVTKKYIDNFGDLFRDAIIRIQADCWLKLQNFAKVIEIAAPIAAKGYKNINDALQIAKNNINP